MSEPQYEVSIRPTQVGELYRWLRDHAREQHFVGSKMVWSDSIDQPVKLIVIINDRDTALLLKLSLS